MTTQTPPTRFFERLDTRLFFLVLFLYQLVFIFQGVDLSDEGFYATFYNQIYKNPESTQYNFMFWLSGIVGGAFDYLFHGLGIWGLRFAGVLVTTSILIITYSLLKKYLNTGHLKIGLLLVVLFINNNLKEVHYNDLSALFNVLIIAYLLSGLKEGKLWKLFVSGVFVSLCTFTRLPNILSLGLGIGIFYYGYHKKTSFKVQLGQAVSFGGGFVLMSAIIVGFMKIIGHLAIFINSIKLLQKMGKGGEESFYGPMVLIKNFIGTYSSALKYTLFILFLVGVLSVIGNLLRKQSFYRKWMTDIFTYAIILAVCLLVYKGTIDNDVVLYFFSGLSMITTLMIVFSRVSLEVKFLALAGCFILMTYPFSSSASLFTVGKYSLWLSLPIAIDYLFNFSSISEFGVGKLRLRLGNWLSVSQPQLKNIQTGIVITCVFACMYYDYYYPFFDKHERTDMRYAINNKYNKWIYTTRERAQVLNELLEQTPKYVKTGDYVLAYHSIPMYHYWTGTVPYLKNSMPWFYTAAIFADELNSTYNEKKVLPVIVQQLKKTVGNAGNWPDPPSYYDSAWHKRNIPRDSVLNEFLTTHHYQGVWNNEVFRIWVPEGNVAAPGLKPDSAVLRQ